MLAVICSRAQLKEFRQDVENRFHAVFDDVDPDMGAQLRDLGRREEDFKPMRYPDNYYRRPYGPGWALVGDAGYHKDPYTGWGMTDAFLHGELLADRLHQGLAGERPMDEALAEYHKVRDEESAASTTSPPPWPPHRTPALLPRHDGRDEQEPGVDRPDARADRRRRGGPRDLRAGRPGAPLRRRRRPPGPADLRPRRLTGPAPPGPALSRPRGRVAREPPPAPPPARRLRHGAAPTRRHAPPGPPAVPPRPPPPPPAPAALPTGGERSARPPRRTGRGEGRPSPTAAAPPPAFTHLTPREPSR
ncbi:NAD(P)/FAD-dependent oxidoreductase [Actinomadura keratinilytica]